MFTIDVCFNKHHVLYSSVLIKLTVVLGGRGCDEC